MMNGTMVQTISTVARAIVNRVLEVTKPGVTGADLVRVATERGGTKPWLSYFYLAHGCGTDSAEMPFVGTDLGGTSELLGDGAGSLVEPSDSVELAAEITRLLEDWSARSELSRIGRRKVEDRYDIQKNLPALLKELIDG